VRRDLGAVALGGAAGTLARDGSVRAFPVGAGTFPTTILVVNLLASFLLGAALARLDERSHPGRALPEALRPLLVAGFVGGLGTLSAIVVDAALLVDAGRSDTALAYVAATVAGGLAAVAAGLRAGGWHAFSPPMPEEDEL